MVRGAALLFRQLESVSLRRATHLSDSALTCLAQSCGPHLKVQTQWLFHGPHAITPWSFIGDRHQPHLQAGTRGSTSQQRMPKLGNDLLEDPGYGALETLSFTLKLRVMLRQEVDLSGCQCLTDAGIASLARHCPNLRAIDVSSGYDLTDRAFSALAACRELRTVNACGCDRLSDTGLCALVHGTRYACHLHAW